MTPEFQGGVATIGNYDGVHLGHRAIIDEINQLAHERQAPSLVICFEPTPGEFFKPANAPSRLTRFREKYAALAQTRVDGFFCLRFNREFAELPPETFIDRVLVSGLKIQALVVGDDFRFGRNRMGDFDMLKQAGDRFGFSVQQTKTVEFEPGKRISSSLIRSLLASGDVVGANQLLGRPYSMCGRVLRGKQLGRQLGYPTANLRLHRVKTPLHGIFAVQVQGVSHKPLDGVASLGTRPTVNGEGLLLEVHIFDFDRDIYNRHIEVEFIEKIRDEEKFDSLELLTQQMHRDSEQARRSLENYQDQNLEVSQE